MTLNIAVVEGGGTKFNCAIMDTNKEILNKVSVPTTNPEQTVNTVVDFFLTQRKNGNDFTKLGLACFGPLELNSTSSLFGHILQTPKPQWSFFDIAGVLGDRLNCQVFIDTDVNAVAMAEYLWGASKGTSSSIYITVGTGIGAGAVVNGKILHGLMHPEIGHMLVKPPDGIKGVCPFHENCIEGLASGEAMRQIWGRPAEELEQSHIAWDIQARNLASLSHNLLLCFSPQKLIFGGGVMSAPNLMENVIKYTTDSLAGYLRFPDESPIEEVIKRSSFGQDAGLLGAFSLVR